RRLARRGIECGQARGDRCRLPATDVIRIGLALHLPVEMRGVFGFALALLGPAESQLRFRENRRGFGLNRAEVARRRTRAHGLEGLAGRERIAEPQIERGELELGRAGRPRIPGTFGIRETAREQRTRGERLTECDLRLGLAEESKTAPIAIARQQGARLAEVADGIAGPA